MRVPTRSESAILHSLHARQLGIAIEAARSTQCKGVLATATGAITLSSMVGYGNVYVHPRHYDNWQRRELEANPCFMGHLFPKPLQMNTKCIRCPKTYQESPIEGFITNE